MDNLKYENRVLASDVEAKGFYSRVNEKSDIHCLCSIDAETEEVLLFHNHPEFDNQEVVDPFDNKTYVIPKRKGTLEEGIAFWKKATANGSKLVIHNAHTYDRPVLDKIWPDNGIPFDAYHDTFVQSKVQWYERPCPKGAKSPHGLKAYGILCGINKPEITDWETIDSFKMHRVVEDCRAQLECYKMLQRQRKYLKEAYGIDFTPALKIEAMYAAECFIQEEINKLKIDKKFSRECVKELDILIADLTSKIEPLLPPTVKGKGKKLARSEIATLFGFDGSKIKDKIVKAKKDGEVVEKVVKPYFSPCMKYTKVLKSKLYQGYHFEYEFTPKFPKKMEVMGWIKENYPDTKTKEWSIDKEDIEKEVLDKHTCDWFGLEEIDTDLIGGPFTKIEIKPSTMTQGDVVKGYLIRKGGWKHAEEWNLKTDVYDNNIKVEEETEVRWPPNAPKEHQIVKKIPAGGLLVSSPKLSEEDYDQLGEGIGKMVAEYNTYQHRRRFLENPKDPENKGILSYLDENDRIPAGVNNFGTRSGRGSHRVWVNSPGAGSLYGENIRKCVIAEKGWKLVGIDMKSAQLSIAAYDANNYSYYQANASGIEKDESTGIYYGESAHCINSRMFGLVSEKEWKKAVETQSEDLIHSISLRRKNSKGGSFAVIFGASGVKVARTLKIPESKGSSTRKQFLEQMGLDEVSKFLENCSKKTKYKGGYYLPLAFGYWLWNNSGHKDINTIVQGFEALAQKLAVIRVSKEIRRLGLEDHMKKILDMHDEYMLEVREGYEDKARELMEESYTWAGEQIYNWHMKYPEHFPNKGKPKFSIDLNGGAKVGDNYLDVH